MSTIKLETIKIDRSPEGYIPSPELIRALEIAYALRRPLLLSGEPGTGKSDFARWVAYDLQQQGFNKDPLVYNTKSYSVAQDLFYHYDAVSHFRDNQTSSHREIEGASDAELVRIKNVEDKVHIEGVQTINETIYPVRTTVDYIELKALGLAFARAIGTAGAGTNKPLFKAKEIAEDPSGSVVLVDEIDKASRDFPNDLLNEIEGYEFEIRELNRRVGVPEAQRGKLIIILTSNFEKNLPEAFLRRCIYFHIVFPDHDALVRIVKKRLGLDKKSDEEINARVKEFLEIRNMALQKKPSTSELLDWLRALHADGNLSQATLEGKKLLAGSKAIPYLSILLKKRDDISLLTGI